MNDLIPTYAEAFVQGHRTLYRNVENAAQKQLDSASFPVTTTVRNESLAISVLHFIDGSAAAMLDEHPSAAFAYKLSL
jgi:hypothetical protein